MAPAWTNGLLAHGQLALSRGIFVHSCVASDEGMRLRDIIYPGKQAGAKAWFAFDSLKKFWKRFYNY